MENKLVGENHDDFDVEVIDPSSGEIVTDPTLAAAIRKNVHFIRRDGKTVIQWRPFIRPLRTYTDIPEHFGFTEKETQTFMKMCHETLVPVNVVAKVWAKKYDYGVRFIQAKKIPVFVDPFTHKAHIFSGDLVRAIESCKIDMEADGGAWPKFMIRSRRLNTSKLEKRHAKRAAAAAEKIEKRRAQRLDRASRILETPESGSEGQPVQEAETTHA